MENDNVAEDWVRAEVDDDEVKGEKDSGVEKNDVGRKGTDPQTGANTYCKLAESKYP